MGAPLLDLTIAWQLHVGPTPALDALVARYREPHRHYHGTRHLVHAVRRVLELSEVEPTVDRGAIVAAACFHDAVHRGRGDGSDEEASAALASRSLVALGWPESRVGRVMTMIRATAHHTADPGTEIDPDTAVLLDADLSILGSRPAAYQEYVRGIRAEYPELSHENWRIGRSAVLRSLRARTNLFHTTAARQRWEGRARANIAAELATLDTGPL